MTRVAYFELRQLLAMGINNFSEATQQARTITRTHGSPRLKGQARTLDREVSLDQVEFIDSRNHMGRYWALDVVRRSHA